MINHFLFLSYLILFIISIIGYGIVFSKILRNNLIELNLGYQGFFGFFILSLLSIFTSFFFPHDFLHNIILHIIGLTFFLFFIFSQKRFNEIKNLSILFFILLLSIYVFKNHDDFPYYHLTYSLNLSENGYAVGMGNLGHGFRTFSSLFYMHSIFYMPFIKFYLFHAGPFIIILFFNFVVITELLENFKNEKKIDFIYYFSLLALIFVNIIFYRLGEHGTDRSSQILLLLIFIIFFKVFLYEEDFKTDKINLYSLVIIISLAASIKVIYYLYFLLVPILLFKKKLFVEFLFKKNYLLTSLISFFIFINLTTSYLNTGCLIYPAEKTCFENNEWSISKNEVRGLAVHYEWWSKAGGGPNYKADLDPKIYIKNFNWLGNWVDRHFFNKVSDTLLGIFTISFFLFSILRFFSKKSDLNNDNSLKINKISLFTIYLIPTIFFLEWFLNHPSMRYGGFVLFAIPIFIFFSRIMDKLIISRNHVYKITIFILILTMTIFNIRNILRINKEINFYNYEITKSPFFFVEKEVDTYPIDQLNGTTVYSLKNGGYCWSSPTPCSYSKSVKIKEFLWMNMFYKELK
jgi:hypothetical protein